MSEIISLIPHRYPFLFVDNLITVTEDKITGKRTFTDKDFFFKGHFPEYPIVPGVIIIEAMAQCGGAGVRKLGKIPDNHLFFLATVNKVKFRKPTVPNDTVRFEIKNEKISSRIIQQSGKAFKDNLLCVEAQWMCLVGPTPASIKG